MNRAYWIAAALIATLSCGSIGQAAPPANRPLPAASRSPAGNPSAARSDEARAEEVLHKAADQLNGMKAFSVELAITAQMTTLKGMQSQTMRYTVAVHKPDRVGIVQTTDFESCSVICDGKSFYTYMPPLKKYVIDKAPASLDQIPGERVGMPAGGAAGLFCQTGEAVYQTLRGAAQLHYKGIEAVDGVQCHHLYFDSKSSYNHDLWVDASDKPLLRKTVITHMDWRTNAAGEKTWFPEPGPPEFVTKYGPWAIDAAPPPEAFRINPPADARRAAALDLNELMFGAAYSLRGQPAPNFTDMTLDGRPVMLSKLKGSIVVLGFWNMWWPGGNSSLAGLAELAQKYRGKGVQVYAVNVGDKPDVARQNGGPLNGQVPVLLDTARAAGKAYAVRKLPHTVVIDKEGTVRFVEVFWSGGTKITALLDTLLAGKEPPAEAELPPLASEPAPSAK